MIFARRAARCSDVAARTLRWSSARTPSAIVTVTGGRPRRTTLRQDHFCDRSATRWHPSVRLPRSLPVDNDRQAIDLTPDSRVARRRRFRPDFPAGSADRTTSSEPQRRSFRSLARAARSENEPQRRRGRQGWRARRSLGRVVLAPPQGRDRAVFARAIRSEIEPQRRKGRRGGACARNFFGNRVCSRHPRGRERGCDFPEKHRGTEVAEATEAGRLLEDLFPQSRARATPKIETARLRLPGESACNGDCLHL